MAKSTNKQHEEQQDRRIKKLENDLKQQKDTINKLVKRAKAGDVLNDKWKRKISILEIRKKIKNSNLFYL
jgi:uncharacterized coiled-coil protein SlyX